MLNSQVMILEFCKNLRCHSISEDVRNRNWGSRTPADPRLQNRISLHRITFIIRKCNETTQAPSSKPPASYDVKHAGNSVACA